MTHRGEAAGFDQKVQELTGKFLRKQLWVIISSPARSVEDMAPFVAAHLKYVLNLERLGVVYCAGPFLDEAGRPTGEGMLIVRSESLAKANEIANADPFHQAAVRRFTIKEWQCNVGRQTITVQFSDQSYDFI